MIELLSKIGRGNPVNNESTHILISKSKFLLSFVVLGLLLATAFIAPQAHAAAPASQPSSLQNSFLAEATWINIVQNASFSQLDLVVASNHSGTDIYITKNVNPFDVNFTFVTGHLFSADKRIFSIDNNLNSAHLSAVTVALCSPNNQDINGNCTVAEENMTLQATWTGSGALQSNNVASKERFGVDRMITRDNSAIRSANATGTINGGQDLGQSIFPTLLEKDQKLVIQHANSGNSAGVGTQAFGVSQAGGIWQTTLDGQAATISIDAQKADTPKNGVNPILPPIPIGTTLVRFEIVFESQYLVGQFITTNDTIFTVDKQLKFAHLSPVAIGVCINGISFNCAFDGNPIVKTYTVKADWGATGSQPQVIRSVVKSTSSGSFSDQTTIMPAHATALINVQNIGPANSADISRDYFNLDFP